MPLTLARSRIGAWKLSDSTSATSASSVPASMALRITPKLVPSPDPSTPSRGRRTGSAAAGAVAARGFRLCQAAQSGGGGPSGNGGENVDFRADLLQGMALLRIQGFRRVVATLGEKMGPDLRISSVVRGSLNTITASTDFRPRRISARSASELTGREGPLRAETEESEFSATITHPPAHGPEPDTAHGRREARRSSRW